eukprot:gene5623-6249_t
MAAVTYFFAATALAGAERTELWVDRYSTTWTTAHAATTAEPASWAGMPLGDGDGVVSLTSIDTTGQIALLLGAADAYDEFHELIKVGRVLVDLEPPLLAGAGGFRQTLHLGNAS